MVLSKFRKASIFLVHYLQFRRILFYRISEIVKEMTYKEAAKKGDVNYNQLHNYINGKQKARVEWELNLLAKLTDEEIDI